jgi:hypothetical protein
MRHGFEQALSRLSTGLSTHVDRVSTQYGEQPSNTQVAASLPWKSGFRAAVAVGMLQSLWTIVTPVWKLPKPGLRRVVDNDSQRQRVKGACSHKYIL